MWHLPYIGLTAGFSDIIGNLSTRTLVWHVWLASLHRYFLSWYAKANWQNFKTKIYTMILISFTASRTIIDIYWSSYIYTASWTILKNPKRFHSYIQKSRTTLMILNKSSLFELCSTRMAKIGRTVLELIYLNGDIHRNFLILLGKDFKINWTISKKNSTLNFLH